MTSIDSTSDLSFGGGRNVYQELCECIVCFETMKDPKTLHCEHSFCKECLEELVEFKEDSTPFIPCPTCRSECVLVIGETVSSLKAHLILKQLLDEVETSNYNKICKEAEEKLSPKCCDQSIEWYCCDCKIFHCRKCINLHSLSSCGDFYQIKYSERFESFGLYCGKHNSFHSYGCIDCKTTFCSYCRQENHIKLSKPCQIVSIKEYASQFKNPLTEKIVLMKMYNSKQENLLREINLSSSRLKQEEKNIIKYIKEKKMVVLSQMLFMLELVDKKIMSNFHNELTEYEKTKLKLTSEIQSKVISVREALEHSEALAEKSVIEIVSQTRERLVEFYSIFPGEIVEEVANLPEFKFHVENENAESEVNDAIDNLLNATQDAFGDVQVTCIDGDKYNSTKKPLNINSNAIDYCPSMFMKLKDSTEAEKYVLQCLKKSGYLKSDNTSEPKKQSPTLSKLADEIKFLIGNQPSMQLSLSALSMEYSKHFKRPLITSEYGFNKMKPLINSMSSHFIQILEGNGNEIYVCLADCQKPVDPLWSDMKILLAESVDNIALVYQLCTLYKEKMLKPFPNDSGKMNEFLTTAPADILVIGEGSCAVISYQNPVDYPAALLVDQIADILHNFENLQAPMQQLSQKLSVEKQIRVSVNQIKSVTSAYTEVLQVTADNKLQLTQAGALRLLRHDIAVLMSEGKSKINFSGCLDELKKRFQRKYSVSKYGETKLQNLLDKLGPTFIQVVGKANQKHVTFGQAGKFYCGCMSLLNKCGGVLSVDVLRSEYERVYKETCTYGSSAVEDFIENYPELMKIYGQKDKKMVVLKERLLNPLLLNTATNEAGKERANISAKNESKSTDGTVFGAISADYESFVKVYDDNDDDSSSIEIPCETDGTLLLCNIQACFPDVTGLRYKTATGSWRLVRLVNGVLHPPQNGWSASNYCIGPNKTDDTVTVVDDGDDVELQSLERHKQFFREAIAQGFALWLSKRVTTPSNMHQDVKLFIARYSSVLKANKVCGLCKVLIVDNNNNFCPQCSIHLCPTCYKENKVDASHSLNHKVMQLSFTCDGCTAYIIRTRKQCNSCKNFNLCLSCYKSDTFPTRHSPKHQMTTYNLITEGGEQSNTNKGGRVRKRKEKKKEKSAT